MKYQSQNVWLRDKQVGHLSCVSDKQVYSDAHQDLLRKFPNLFSFCVCRTSFSIEVNELDIP